MFNLFRRRRKEIEIEYETLMTETNPEISETQKNKYKDFSAEELLKRWDEESRRCLRGVGKWLERSYCVWSVPIDLTLVKELGNRGIPFGRSDDFGIYNPSITPEELSRFESETMAILEERGDRFVVIDTCTPEKLDSKLEAYRGKPGIYYTPNNHAQPCKIYGPLPIEHQPVLS